MTHTPTTTTKRSSALSDRMEETDDGATAPGPGASAASIVRHSPFRLRRPYRRAQLGGAADLISPATDRTLRRPATARSRPPHQTLRPHQARPAVRHGLLLRHPRAGAPTRITRSSHDRPAHRLKNAGE